MDQCGRSIKAQHSSLIDPRVHRRSEDLTQPVPCRKENELTSSPIKKIGVLTGGGDAPGLNAVIRAIVKTAINVYGWSVIGVENGFEGLLGEPHVRPLRLEDVRGLLPRGGTILGTTNRGHFIIKKVGDPAETHNACYLDAIENCRKLGLDALITIGGEGTQSIAHGLQEMGLKVVGVPKTIDNDLFGTDATFGFDTALEISTEAIDRLHTTAESHGRVMLVEVMGRHAGWIALHSGIAGGADVILLPEIPFSMEKIAAKIAEREAHGSHFSIIVVAEGAAPIGEEPIYQEMGNAECGPRLGGLAEHIAAGLTQRTGKETRVVVLGHLQRGGTPTASDRVLATCYGSMAVHAIAKGLFGNLVSWDSKQMSLVPLDKVVSQLKVVPLDHYLISSARNVGISFAGIED